MNNFSKYVFVRLTLVSLIVVSTIATTESDSYRGPSQPVDAAFFGMHVHRAANGTDWPPVPFEGWRLWDVHVTWPEIEPQRGKWDFTLLDRYVQIAQEHHVSILLTLGLTPAWSSARPSEKSSYGPGNASEPTHLSDWENYVRTVAARYKGVIHNYEIWNEPNVKGTFTGDAAAMLGLSRSAYATLKSVDPTITVVSPSPTAWDGIPWLNTFLRLGGCQYADVIGYHFYVTPDAPEKVIPLIQRVKSSLRTHGCDKPLWNTESGWAEPKHFSTEAEAAGYLMRTYILNWLLGVQRCYWYAWDNHNWSTLDLTSRSDSRMVPAGAAYGVIHTWLLGGVLRSCQRERSGMWICEVQRGTSTNRIVWSDSGSRKWQIPASWGVTTTSDWRGSTSRASEAITVSDAPVLLSGT